MLYFECNVATSALIFAQIEEIQQSLPKEGIRVIANPNLIGAEELWIWVDEAAPMSHPIFHASQPLFSSSDWLNPEWSIVIVSQLKSQGVTNWFVTA